MEKNKIKTLKELAKFEQDKFEKETNLKLANGVMPLHIEILRAEAVKRVKNYQKKIDKAKASNEIPDVCYYEGMRDAEIIANDLTKEDLK